MRTYYDYEVLRHFALEGDKWQGNIEGEAAVFLSRGTVAWMRSNRGEHMAGRRKWGNLCLQPAENDLSVLLANLIES